MYQGERVLTKDNKLVGQFNLNDLPPSALTTKRPIKVTCDIDANGITTITAAYKNAPSESLVLDQEKER